MDQANWRLQEDGEISRLMRRVKDQQSTVRRLRAAGRHGDAVRAGKLLELSSNFLSKRRAQLAIKRFALGIKATAAHLM